MRTTPMRARAAGLAAAAVDLHEPLLEAEPGARLLLTVWPKRSGCWRALAELPDGTTHSFDSPLELARFLAHWPDVRPPLAEPMAGSGLR